MKRNTLSIMVASKQEIRLAQKALINGNLREVYLRLQGTQYDSIARELWEMVGKLNDRLIKDIR